jgi:hypothetical protein
MVLSMCSGSLLFTLIAFAQYRNIGRFDTWTTKHFEHKHESRELSYIRVVRAAEQNGFDRVVFEFAGPIPNYSIKYLSSRTFTSGDSDTAAPIKIAGGAFIHVNFNLIPSDDKQVAFASKQFLPKGPLRLPALQEMEDAGLWEGDYSFLLGVESRTPFRVSELSNPARLAIDLKH